MEKIDLVEPAAGFVSRLGAAVERFFAVAGSLAVFAAQTVGLTFRRPFRVGLIAEQMESMGLFSLPIALLTAMFTGMVLVLQTATGLERFGAKEIASGIAALAFTREIGPVLTSVVIAGRVGAGIAAEVGTMKVTEQIDALRTLATNPIHYLVVPRFISGLIMLPVITIFADVIGLVGGYVVGVYSLGIPSMTYIQTTQDWLTVRDLTSGVFKTTVFGMIIAIVACYQGFNAEGGAEGVGRATTRAVVLGSILILISNYFLTDLIIRYSGILFDLMKGLLG
jgi:phospholipid/cholesterol/gamma-HCH transport system permease protein